MGSFAEKLKQGLARSRQALSEIFYFAEGLDEDFWEELEDRLVMGDCGCELASSVVDDLREIAAKNNLRTPSDIKDCLKERLVKEFYTSATDPFIHTPSCAIFVGINGAGKTTTVGKLAYAAKHASIPSIIGAADTFRAAAIEQLQVWADRAGVVCVARTRGCDPASVCFDTLERAQEEDSQLVLIDTAGRLHTSRDLMEELGKVVTITRKHASMPVYVVLVIDANCGQNGLVQAQKFNEALGLDGIIITKLDGTSKGGIAIRASHDLKLPIFRVGVGEGIDDLQAFSAQDFCQALIEDK